MARFEYETIKFIEEKDRIKCVFMKIFYFYLEKNDVILLSLNLKVNTLRYRVYCEKRKNIHKSYRNILEFT